MTPERQVKTLIAQLRDKDKTVRQKAANALGQMGESAQAAIPALAHVLRNDEDKTVRGVAAFALGQMGDAAVPALIPLLNEPALRLKVAKTLRQIGTPEALKAIEATESKR